MKFVIVFTVIAAVIFVRISAQPLPRDGANMEVWPCDGSERQQWAIGGDDLKTIYMLDTEPPKCVDVNEQEWGMLNTSVWLQTCSDTRQKYQHFQIENPDGGPILYPPGKGCLTVDWNEVGGNVEVWECDGSSSQSWIFNKTDNSVRSAENGMCLDAGALNHCDLPPISDLPFCNPEASPHDRAVDLVSRFNFKEKISQMTHVAAAIARLGVPMYNWWSEALHGIMSVCGEKCPTSFPSPIGLGAAFNMTLIKEMGTVISTEGRALHNEGLVGLDFWAPNINIFRDPRWGRGQETPGEDPLLSARYVSNYMTAMQEGDDPKYTKVIGTCKHYAAYSLENWGGVDRYEFDAIVTDQDLVETYFPAFEACVRIGKAQSVMCSYNSVNGVPACADKFLLQEILRDEWEFPGYIVSDCDAIAVIQYNHNYTTNPADTCGVAMAAGTDLNCGTFYTNLDKAVAAGTVSMEQIDQAVIRLFEHRFRLGMFDPVDMISYNKLDEKDIDNEYHRAVALDAAHQSIVLLKNDQNILPLKKDAVVALIGPNANATDALLGNYAGTPSFIISPLEGMQMRSGKVLYEEGCDVYCNTTDGFAAAKKTASEADVVVLVMGIDQTVEAEGMDRTEITLPGLQTQLVQEIMAIGKPTVVVLINGGPLAIEWIAENAHAIVAAFYGGEYGGQALADVLYGDYNPAGRLTTTWYPAEYVKQISMKSMKMNEKPGHTYRYYTGKPVFEFGYGLSYTTFDIQWHGDPKPAINTEDTLSYAATVTNTGSMAGDEVVLGFVSSGGGPDAPIKQLFGFERIHLNPGESKDVFLDMTPGLRSIVDKQGQRWSAPGSYKVQVGKLSTTLTVTGAPLALDSMFDY